MMKTMKWIAVGLLVAVGAQAAVITTHPLFDSYTQDNNVAGSGDGVADGANNADSFEQYIGAAAGGAEERKAFFNIDLPTTDGVNALSSSTDISTATLRVYYGGDNGTPTDDLSLFYATKSSITTVPADMYSTAYADTGLEITQGATSGQYYEFDVTSYVKSAYDDANGIASFRFEVDGDITLGAGAAVYKLRGASSQEGMYPELVLETIPEPATLGLVVAFSSGIIFIRRRFMI